MIARVEIEGLDRTGKDTLVGYIDYMSGRLMPVGSRGLLSTLAYAEIFNRYLPESYIDKMIEANKETLVVYLTAEMKDWEMRMKISHHENIDFTKQTTIFNKWKSILKQRGILVYEFNTTNQTPYNIAEMVCTVIEEENRK